MVPQLNESNERVTGFKVILIWRTTKVVAGTRDSSPVMLATHLTGFDHVIILTIHLNIQEEA
jgi:hypothetical protein